MEEDMQNKPNFMRFCAVNDDYEKKQTQTNPIQTQFKAIFTPKNQPQTQNKPNLKRAGEKDFVYFQKFSKKS